MTNIFFTLLLFFSYLSADQNFKEIDVEEMVLESGMLVYLKPIHDEEGVVSYQLAAKGGFTSFPEELQPAARMTPDALWYSGIGELDGNELSQMLYTNSLDFNYSIEPYYRYITGESYTDNARILLQLMADFFSKPHFTKAGIDELIRDEIDELRLQKENRYNKIEESYYQLNGITASSYHPKPLDLIKKLTPDIAKNTYQTLFQSPEDFVLVISGDFNLKTMKNDVNETLGKLKKGGAEPLKIRSKALSPSDSKTVLLESNTKDTEFMTRMTFQMPFKVDQKNFYPLELLTQALEIDMREIFKKILGNTAGVDIGIEFPFYPLAEDLWFTVQFRSSQKESEMLARKVQETLLTIQKTGLSSSTIEKAKENMISSDNFWQHEPSYWLNQLTNDYLFGWNPQKSFEEKKLLYQAPASLFNTLLKELNFNRFTLLVAEVGR